MSRCYSPVAFGKKTDPDGEYIKKYLPQLRNFPKKYIYEPWLAPKSMQVLAVLLPFLQKHTKYLRLVRKQ